MSNFESDEPFQLLSLHTAGAELQVAVLTIRRPVRPPLPPSTPFSVPGGSACRGGGRHGRTTKLRAARSSLATNCGIPQEVLNAFNAELILEVRRALKQVSEDDSIRALVLTGEGRGFSAGADLGGGGYKGDPRNLTAGENASHGMEHRWNPMMQDFHDLNKPTVTAINGVAAGGGVGLALVSFMQK